MNERNLTATLFRDTTFKVGHQVMKKITFTSYFSVVKPSLPFITPHFGQIRDRRQTGKLTQSQTMHTKICCLLFFLFTDKTDEL